MPIDSRRIALQLGNSRGTAPSVGEWARGLAKIRELGCELIEVGPALSLEAGELRELADAAGLGIVASHEDPRDLVEQPSKVAERLGVLGCRFAVYSRPHLPLSTLDQVFELADRLSRAGEALRRQGRLLTYHNHALEFRKLEGKAVLDWLYERSDPFTLHAELDTYFVQAGGGDPAGYCARLSGRLPLLQVKDYAIDAEGQPYPAALGEGNLNLWKIVREAEAAACEYYVIAHELAPGAEAFAALEKSFRYLRSL